MITKCKLPTALHMENHKAWLRIIAEYSYLIKFKGIMLTGWQRYDHFAVLCELLPVSIPSLVNSILILRGNKTIVTKKPINHYNLLFFWPRILFSEYRNT